MSEIYGIRSKRKLKTHCYRGHEFTQKNTLINSGGYRYCKRCARLNGSQRCTKFRKRKAIANAAET